MNFKAASLCVLSLSLISLSPEVFAAKKSAMEEIKSLQQQLLKSRNSVDTLLNTKAHQINKDTESKISGVSVGNYTNKQPIYGAVRQMSLEAMKVQQREDLFAGSDAIENLLKNYRLTAEDKIETIVNPSEKVYSIAVINPQHLEAMKKANAELFKIMNSNDDLLERMIRYTDLTIKGKRYLTFKEAENLSNQIYKMNSDLQDIEELSIKLPSADQKAVESFVAKMNDFLNKKLVFTEINKKGFTTTIDADTFVSLNGNSHVEALSLGKDYSAQNIAAQIKKAIQISVTHHVKYERWNDFRFYVHNNNKPYSQKISIDELNFLDVKLNEARNVATISTKKFSFQNDLSFPRSVKMFFLQDGKAFYDHAAQDQTDYYNPNSSLVKAQLKMVVGYEIQMKNMYKNFGLEKFGTDLGKVDFSVK